jgi:predicted chitinase
VLSQCTTVNRIAYWLAQMGDESAASSTPKKFSPAESRDRWKYKGRTWIQITWESNYAAFSNWLFGKGLISSPTYFVDHSEGTSPVAVGRLWDRRGTGLLPERRSTACVTPGISLKSPSSSTAGRTAPLTVSLDETGRCRSAINY